MTKNTVSRSGATQHACGPDKYRKVSELQKHEYQTGDLVVYTMSKHSPHPGPRARSVHPAEQGEDYSYLVDKYWMVVKTIDQDKVQLVTRTGKTRICQASDPLLRKASWWQRIRFRNLFPDLLVLQSLQTAKATT